MTTLNQDNAAEEYAALLKGRHVTNITVSSDETSAAITLDRHHPRTHRKLGM